MSTSTSLAATPAPQIPITETNFHPFPRLPIEVRLKIWHLSFTPRFVVLTVKANKAESAHVPWGSVAKCKEHPFKELIPAVLHTHRESRTDGLEFYTLFESDAFEATYVNLDIDTLHVRHCHCQPSQLESALESNDIFTMFLRAKLPDNIIEALASNAKSVRNVTSLAICYCQTPNDNPENLLLWVPLLKEFESLREIVFMSIGTANFVEGLGSDGSDREDGVADMLRLTPERLRGEITHVVTEADVEGKGVMWDIMKSSVKFKKFLERVAETEEGLVVPAVRCVVVVNGEVAWKQKQTMDTDSMLLRVPNPNSYWCLSVSSMPSFRAH